MSHFSSSFKGAKSQADGYLYFGSGMLTVLLGNL
jgi:hypothetical protein